MIEHHLIPVVEEGLYDVDIGCLGEPVLAKSEDLGEVQDLEGEIVYEHFCFIANPAIEIDYLIVHG